MAQRRLTDNRAELFIGVKTDYPVKKQQKGELQTHQWVYLRMLQDAEIGKDTIDGVRERWMEEQQHVLHTELCNGI